MVDKIKFEIEIIKKKQFGEFDILLLLFLICKYTLNNEMFKINCYKEI